MKKIIVSLLLFLLSACNLPTDSRPRFVDLERDFVLPEGGRAVVRGESLVVEFVGVPLDERCPIEAVCVSAGDATVRLRIAGADHEPGTIDLHTGLGNSATSYGGYLIELLALDPPASVQVADPDYRVTLRVRSGYVID